MAGKEKSAWITKIRADGEKIRMICFPYAGGRAHNFHIWQELIPNSVGLYAIQLPGWGRRLQETPISQIETIVESIVDALRGFDNIPIVFFGHSMGALIAFETARALRRIGATIPVWMFISGFKAPQIEENRTSIHTLSDEAFLKKLESLGGTPPEILQNQEILDLVLPTLRADFAVVDTYMYKLEPPLTCPITAFYGDQDTHFDRQTTADWRSQTTGRFSLHKLTGGHFFIHGARQELLQLINHDLQHVLAQHSHKLVA